MKLYIHDEKHEQILGQLDLGSLTNDEAVLLEKILLFLEKKGVSYSYQRLVIAAKHRIIVQDEEGEGATIIFTGVLAI